MNNGGCDLDERLIATIQRLPHVSLFDLEAGKGCINLWGQCERTTLSWLKILPFSPSASPWIAGWYICSFSRSLHYYCLQPRQFLWFWLNTPSWCLTAGYFLWFQCKIPSLKWKGPLTFTLRLQIVCGMRSLDNICLTKVGDEKWIESKEVQAKAVEFFHGSD